MYVVPGGFGLRMMRVPSALSTSCFGLEAPVPALLRACHASGSATLMLREQPWLRVVDFAYDFGREAFKLRALVESSFGSIVDRLRLWASGTGEASVKLLRASPRWLRDASRWCFGRAQGCFGHSLRGGAPSGSTSRAASGLATLPLRDGGLRLEHLASFGYSRLIADASGQVDLELRDRAVERFGVLNAHASGNRLVIDLLRDEETSVSGSIAGR